jgi:hypothetical protein
MNKKWKLKYRWNTYIKAKYLYTVWTLTKRLRHLSTIPILKHLGLRYLDTVWEHKHRPLQSGWDIYTTFERPASSLRHLRTVRGIYMHFEESTGSMTYLHIIGDTQNILVHYNVWKAYMQSETHAFIKKHRRAVWDTYKRSEISRPKYRLRYPRTVADFASSLRLHTPRDTCVPFETLTQWYNFIECVSSLWNLR